MLVKIKIAPKVNNINPKVPVTVPVKYSPENIKATIILIILSAFPMFDFIPFFLSNLIDFYLVHYL